MPSHIAPGRRFASWRHPLIRRRTPGTANVHECTRAFQGGRLIPRSPRIAADNSGRPIPFSPAERSSPAMFRAEQGILAARRGPGLRLRSLHPLRNDRRAPEGPARPVLRQTGRRPLPLALSLPRGGVWGGVTAAPPVGRAPDGGSEHGTSSPQASRTRPRCDCAQTAVERLQRGLTRRDASVMLVAYDTG